MKKLSKIISVVILAGLVFGITVFASHTILPGSSNQKVSGDVKPNADCGFHGVFAYRIGLSQCVNEEVNYAVSGENAKAEAVQQYAAKYYTPIMGPSVYVLTSSSGGATATADYQGRDCTPASSPALTDILSTIASGGGSSTYVIQLGDGTYCVPPDEAIVTQVMEELKALGGANVSLYNHWVEESKSLDAAKHPVVICIEMVGEVTNDGQANYWLGAADLAGRIGGSSARTQFLSTNIRDTYGPDGHLSITLNALSQICGFHEGTSYWDNWPYRATKHLWSRSFDRAGARIGSGSMYSEIATGAWQTYSGDANLGINGVTVVTVGGSILDGVTGTYTWHINASRLPANSEGYREDNTADSEGDKVIGIGAINIKQDNVPTWRDWINKHSAPFEIKMEKFYTAGDTFSVEYEDVIGSRASSINSLASGRDERSEYVSASQLYNYVSGGSDLDLNGMKSAPTDTLGGSPIGEDRYQVAYATRVIIISADGASVELMNEDTHYAIYGSDKDRTYKYNQMLDDGRSQVKQGDSGLDSEEFEAMSGTPTTKDLFVTQGGEQFIVQLQFRYVDESYQRDYILESEEPYPNFMYYWTSVEDEKNDTSGEKGKENYNDGSYVRSSSSITNPLTEANKISYNNSAYSEAMKGFKAAVAAFDVDTNFGEAPDYDDAHYSINGDPFVKNKTDGVLGEAKTEIAALADTISQITVASPYTKVITLANAEDLDTNKQGKVTVTFSFSGSVTDETESNGTHDTSVCSCSDTDGDGATDHDDDDNRWKWKDIYKAEYKWSIKVDYGPFSRTIEDLEYTNTLSQIFEHVRYMDIVEAQLFRLEGGKQIGLGPILADTPEEYLLNMACEQMGYCIYDSEQADARTWDDAQKQWTAINIADLEATGRVLNSYNKTTVDLSLPDGTTATMEEDVDKVLVKYNMANGGRSHYAYLGYFARVAGFMFYEANDGGNSPYRNTMFISSDVMAINTGDSASNGWEAFVYNDVDTDAVKDEMGLEQYLMNKAYNQWVEFRAYTFRKGDHGCKIIRTKRNFMTDAYLRGKVDLNKMDSMGAYATMYNKEWICELNPYTFVNYIPEQGGITWVGYRGDYMTTSASHTPILKCLSGFTPDLSRALMQIPYANKVFPADMGEINEDMASPTGAFPHQEGLNVIRTLDNNIYKTGYASLYYGRAITKDHTGRSGVLPLTPKYAGANLRIQDTRLRTSSPKCSVRAYYGPGWETPNDVVIFNPSTAENAFIYPMSEYMPDAAEVGGDDDTHPLRDQRASGYFIGTTEDNGIFIETDNPADATVVNPTREVKTLKDVSEKDTTYYTVGRDYNIVSSSVETNANLSDGSTFTAIMDTTYKFTVYDSTGSGTAVRVRLNKGDKVYNSKGTLYKVARNAVVTYADLLNENNVTSVDVNPSVIQNGSQHSFILSELSTIKAGEVIHLHYEFDRLYNKSNPPFDVSVVVDNSAAIADKLVQSANGDIWDYYIEFKEDCRVSKIVVDFNQAGKLLMSSDTYILEFIDQFIVSPGAAYSSPANQSTTIDFVCLGNESNAYNINFVDYDEALIAPDNLVAYRYYITYSATSVLHSIKAESANDPHIVYNSNWKYYVIGWRTQNGNTIESPTDTLLNYDDTVLMWPSGLGTITVGELKNTACLVKYNNSVYLTTREAGLEHKIMETGWLVTSFDLFTFAVPDSSLPMQTIGSGESYPLRSGQTGQIFQDGYYEFFFQLSTGSGADGILYDVKFAKNPAYRYSKDDLATTLNRANWTYDWDLATIVIDSSIFGTIRKDVETDATYLSLDDKFTIHYDNIGNYHETDWHNQGSTNVDLGYGFYDGMDTITWIEYKYVRFQFDVYCYGWNDAYGCPDPSVTYEEYNSGHIDSSRHVGSPRTGLYYVPAGTPIMLGYYEGDSGEADNACHFIDFGANCGYDYNFWVVLSSNEVKTADSLFVSSNINNNGTTEDCTVDNNKDAPSAVYQRYANAMRVDAISIVGRIGNLTMIDTGDYRFSDTFKTVANNADWLVYGLIKKLSPYSNLLGTPSTQKALLLDPWDVRGRLGIKSLVDSTYSGYTLYGNTDNPGYSTYNTQWHKVGDNTRIAALPLTSSFNDHDALKLTQQKIGYSNLLTLDSIGNYYGSSGNFSYGNGIEPDPDTEMINANGDYGNMKIQVRPYYIAINVSDPSHITSTPVDVYMKTTNGYKLINSGSTRAKDVVNSLYDNAYFYYLENNTENEDPANKTFRLDQNMLRRMVTVPEASITWDVTDAWRGGDVSQSYYSMLTNVDEFRSNGWDIENAYTYGNGQYMFLRDRNRTFVGDNSIALGYDEPDEATNQTSYKSHAQKWYFDLGLPSSAVFVPTGTPFSVDSILNDEGIYILSCVDVYAMGEVWQLHYKSPVSEQSLEINGIPLSPDVWNPSQDKLPWLIPVTFYDASETTAQDDLTTEGTH